MSVISHLVAMAKNRVIGVNNDLPWSLPDDLNHFKQYTLNKPIVMGRKTFESIGKPLPQRINIVISRSLSEIDGVNIFSDVEDGIAYANQYNEKNQLEDEVIIIGGAQIFNETLPIMNRLVLEYRRGDLKNEGNLWCKNQSIKMVFQSLLPFLIKKNIFYKP